jgi:hypothetical protein
MKYTISDRGTFVVSGATMQRVWKTNYDNAGSVATINN